MEELSMKNTLKAGDERKIEEEFFQYIVIRLGDEQYGIDIRYIDNIVRMQHITRVPKVPAYLKGVINLRGEVLPVMSLRLKMGLEADELTRATRIIILKLEEQGSVGIIVDEVKEVVTLGTSEIEKMSQNAGENKKSFITGVGKHNGELISLLDLNSITLEENDIIELISAVAVNRKCLSKGGEPDYSKAAALIIDDFRSGKLGHITLERPEI